MLIDHNNIFLQELFEGEVKRSEKLASRLQRSKDEALHYRTKLKLVLAGVCVYFIVWYVSNVPTSWWDTSDSPTTGEASPNS